VDGGGAFDARFDVGEAVVAPYLWSHGVRRIEGIVLTHAHPDHAGGLPFLLRAFDVGEFWDGPRPRSDRAYAPLDAALAGSGAVARAVHRGVAATWDGVSVDVLGPPPGRRPWRTRNDDSVVLSLGWGRVRVLLTGDVEAAGEASLPAGPVTVLKVPHHGSRSSSTPGLLDGSRPALAIVSVGRNSRFGHPHPEVLERYRARRIPLIRTDQDGTVTVATDGAQLRVETWH
jgi:competence protein ComEC